MAAITTIDSGLSGQQKEGLAKQGAVTACKPSLKKVELRKAEQPWQRLGDLQLELTEEQKETKEVFRKFQSILNKLTPQKFTKLADMTLQLKINTEERLRGVVDKICTRAIRETMYSEVYANLCRVLAPVRIDTKKEGKPQIIAFRRLLLAKCQQEFEKDKQEDEEREAMQKGVEAAETEEIRKQQQQELEAAEITSRHRSLGNIRFIGELYKLKILSESIVHECMIRLLKSASDEESLECFAKLMATTGKDLDKEEAKQRIDTYFSRVNDIIKKGKISSRIRFVLQDVVDLRENNWVPRQRQESQVKTIDQIHREAQDEEQLTKQMASQYVGGAGGMYGQRDSRPVEDRGRGSKPGPGGEEWSNVEKRPQQSRPDLERIRSVKKPGDKEKESSGLRAVSKWDNKGAATTSVAPEPPKQAEKLSKPPSRSSSGGGGSEKPDKAPAMAAAAKVSPSALPPRRSSTHPEEKAAVLQAVKEMTSGTAQKKSGDPAPDQSPELDEETVTKGTENIIGELCENKDLKEAVERVKEMQSPGLLHVFVSEAIKYSLENTSECRRLVGQLFNKLLQDGTLALNRMVVGLGDILESAEDIEIDVPKIWDYIGELLCHPVAHRSLPLGTLITTTFPPNLLSSGKAALLTTRLLRQCVVVTSEEAVSLLWSDCREQHQCLQLRPGDLEQLEFLGRTEVAVPDPYSRLVEGLTEQIGSSNVTNEDIFNWIESKCSAEVRSTRMFIRSLTTAIVQAAVTGKGSSARYSEDLFLKRFITLRKYVNLDKNLELEVLLALQVAITKLDHPPKLLCQMFNAVYDCEVVTENTCYVWRDQEQGVEGKGTAVMSVKPFFDWLDSAERESDPEDTSQARPT